MSVTRDVILDLLPLYLSDEASEDTRKLVTEYLARDPDLASQLREEQLRLNVEMGAPVPPGLEVRALSQLRRQIAVRQWTFGIACFLTAAAFGVQISFEGVGAPHVQFLLSRYPGIFIPLAAAAVGCWALHFSLRRR